MKARDAALWEGSGWGCETCNGRAREDDRRMMELSLRSMRMPQLAPTRWDHPPLRPQEGAN